MKHHRFALAAFLLTIVAWPGLAEEGAKVDFKTYGDYFESNRSGLKGPESFLVITDRKKFDATFGLATVMGRKPEVLPADAFDSRIVLVAIHRGNAIWTYKVESVQAQGGVLSLHYRAESKDGGSATFASPLIVSVPKGDYKSVEFIENGKKVATVRPGQ
jgi:hypothetical protein